MSILSDYKEYVLAQRRRPISLFDFVEDATTLKSVSEIEGQMWKRYAESTLENCLEDPAFGEYFAREKMLSYVYNLLHLMQEDVTVIQLQFSSSYKWWWNKEILSEFKQEFFSFVSILIEEGQERGEIQKRVYLHKIYPQLFWNTLLSILSFWANDDSEYKEQTDVAVEKWVNLLFDTLAPNAMDSAVDLAQFILKRRFYGEPR